MQLTAVADVLRSLAPSYHGGAANLRSASQAPDMDQSDVPIDRVDPQTMASFNLSQSQIHLRWSAHNDRCWCLLHLGAC